MDSFSTSSSSLGGPSQFYSTNQDKYQKESKYVSSLEKLHSTALSKLESTKQIKSSSNEKNKILPLKVEPSIVKFDSIDIGIRYVQNISVRNTTNAAQRIRFNAPKSPYFSLNYIPTGAVAPGLDVIAEVECQLPDNSDQYVFTDTISVMMGQHTTDIPLIANKLAPNVLFNPFFDMGMLLEKQPTTITIPFENQGLVPAVIQFKTTRESKFLLEPLRATIQPKSILNLNIRCDCREIGSFREIIPITITGLLEEMTLDISARVLNQKLNLMSLDKKGIIDHLDFGTLYYGQLKEIRTVLVNTGPVVANFTIGVQDDSDPADSQLPTTGSGNSGGSNETNKSIIITPLDGSINPFSELPIVIKYQPQLHNPNKGFIKQHLLENSEISQHSYRVNIDVLDLSDQSSTIILHGNVVLPSYKLSSSILRFGTVPLNDHRDILISLQSTSPIPMKYEFTKVAQYKFTPCNGIIQPGQTLSILVSIFPVQLGEIKKVSNLLIEDGIRNTEIRLIAECIPSNIKKKLIGGIDKLPEDFEHVPKFVDPIEVAKQRFSQTTSDLNGGGGGGGGETKSKFQRIPPWNSQEFLSSTSWDEVYESTVGGGGGGGGGIPVSANNDPVTYSLQDLQRRANHKETYTQFIRQSHAKRIAQKSHKIKLKAKMLNRPDPLDPLGVDMGMEKGLGDGPILKIPVANEPLWLANNGEKGDKMKFQFDENRLITKKAKEGPTTQAEQRDCSLELSSEQLKHIIPSHKIINFGKVCVNSVNYKNFAVTNELQHMVLIKLNSLESEVRGSKPLSQVLQPNGGVIGFDIQFICRDVGKYKKTFGWSINDRHSYKVTILAEVIPIEITLDKHVINMEFPGESLEKTHTEKLIMTNPGNAIAEYVWGNRGAFRCIPEQGTLHPGGSMVVNVNWTPDPNHSNTEAISLIVTGGIEQILTLNGQLSDGKIIFEDKKLSIGTIAVGSDKKYSVSIRNIGTTPTVFFIGEIPSNYYLEIKPDKGLLLPNELLELDVYVRPKNRINYENKIISMNVRGGKMITLKLSGEAIIPKISLDQNILNFGHVVTGSRQLLPLTLTNIGTIDIVLFLDFHLYPDFKPCLYASEDIDLSSTNIWEDNNGNILENIRYDPATSTSTNPTSGNINNSHKWKIIIRVNTSLNAYIIFAPTVAKSHNFKLPLSIQGIPPEGSIPPCQVTADGLLSRLHVSSYIIDFQDRVVARDPTSRMSYYKEIIFKNIDLTAGLSYEIRDSSPTSTSTTTATSGTASSLTRKNSSNPTTQPIDDQPVYFISPMRGDLSPNESTTIRITFLPKHNGDFIKILQIYISGQPDINRPYFTLLIRGSGVYPRLSFSKSRIILPSVPLQITSRATCVIYNQGYDNIELKYRISPTIPIPIHIIFPEGNELGLTKDKCTIIICARCDVSPESWIGKIEFYDNDGEKFFLDISGCSDCCLLTIDPFIHNYSDKYGFLALDDQPIRLCSKKEIALLKSQEVKQKSANRKKILQQSTTTTGTGIGVDGSKNMKKLENESLVSDGKDTSSAGAGTTSGPTPSNKISLDDLSEGIDITRNNDVLLQYNDDIIFLIKWLNHCICKKPFDLNNLLDCILRSNGDIVIDCIEQLSGKKISHTLLPSTNKYTGGAGASGGAGGGGGTASSSSLINENENNNNSNNSDLINSMSNRLSNMNKLLVKYTNLLAYLTRCGGLVLHIPPSYLLNRDDYLLSHEIDLKQSEGIRLTQAMLKDKRNVWYMEWESNCMNSWSHILFQSYKIFVLNRITYQDYLNTPGIVIQPTPSTTTTTTGNNKNNDKNNKNKSITAGGSNSSGGGGGHPGQGGDGNKKKKGASSSTVKCPLELQSSNIFTQAEAIILSWITYHQLRASRLPDTPTPTTPLNAIARMPSMNRRILDPTTELQDFFIFCQVLHSHLPELTLNNGTLTGYTFTEMTGGTSTSTSSATNQNLNLMDKKENFDRLLNTLINLKLNFNIEYQDFCHQQQLSSSTPTLPSPSPSSSSGRIIMILIIHFFLNLPTFIPKTIIEFKGSLSTPIIKTIELKNPSKKMVCYDVTLEGSNDYTIEHQSIVLEPDTISGYTITCIPHFSKPSKAKLTFWGIREHGVGGSNLVFELISKVTDRPPLQIIKKSCNLFDHEIYDIEITNPFHKDCNFTIQLIQNHLPMTLQQYLGQQQQQQGGGGNGGKNLPPNGPNNPTNGNNKRNSVSGTNQAMAALLNEVNGGQRGGGGGGGSGGTGGGSHTSDGNEHDDEDYQKLFYEPLWINETNIHFTSNETKKIHIHMLPFVLGSYTCQIVLVDPNIGEFCYNLHVNVIPPKPLEELIFENIQLNDGDVIQKIIRISSSNTLYDKAIINVTDARLPLNKRVKARNILQNMIISTISNDETGQSQFGIEMDNNYFQPQKEFGLVTSAAAAGTSNTSGNNGKQQPSQQQSNKKYNKVLKNSIEPYTPLESTVNSIVFSFYPHQAGIYKSLLFLYSLSNQYDIRCLLITAKIIPSNTLLSLIFKGPSRQKIFQDIPLTNDSDVDWNLQAIINGRGFSGIKSLIIPAKSHSIYTVTFIGPYIGEFDGSLLLKNLSNTSDSYDFKLKGIAEEPLAEMNLQYQIKARQIEKFKIKLPYTGMNNEPQVMDVETDIQYLSGDSEIVVLPESSPSALSTSSSSSSRLNEYEFSLNCPVGGHMNGSITFKEKNSNQMVWYTLDIDITSPTAESTIEVEAEVRKAVVVEITLENPTQESLIFDVVIEGDGLLGDTTFTLPPPSATSSSSSSANGHSSSSTYELIYSPLKAGNYIGSITFMNDIIGEFWYKIILTAHAASPIEVKMIECMVGTTGSISVPIENPLSFPISCTATIEDIHHFSIHPEAISLGPYAQSSFTLYFTPSSFNEIIHSTITLTNKSLGEIVYNVSGKGLLPGVMPIISISAPMNEIGSHTIPFRNPFPFPLPIDVILTENSVKKKGLEHKDNLNSFSLLLKKSTGIVLAPDSSLQTPISFQPTHLGDYSAAIEYRSTVSGRNLLWCFPLQGIAEAGIPFKLPKLTIECKSSLLREVQVPLIGLSKDDMDLSAISLADFFLDVKPRDKAQIALISRTFRVQLIDIVETTSSLSTEATETKTMDPLASLESPKPVLTSQYAIVLRLLFEPLKSYRSEIEILIKCKTKGQWRADVQLEALDPPPDDIITLTAAVGEIDKVAFRLTNRFLGYSPFEAYFTPRSSPHFIVSPSSGVLAPFGSTEGTQFVITFAPKEYGIREIATLVVSTAEAQWNYQITGNYPDVRIDRSMVKSKIDTRRG